MGKKKILACLIICLILTGCGSDGKKTDGTGKTGKSIKELAVQALKADLSEASAKTDDKKEKSRTEEKKEEKKGEIKQEKETNHACEEVMHTFSLNLEDTEENCLWYADREFLTRTQLEEYREKYVGDFDILLTNFEANLDETDAPQDVIDGYREEFTKKLEEARDRVNKAFDDAGEALPENQLEDRPKLSYEDFEEAITIAQHFIDPDYNVNKDVEMYDALKRDEVDGVWTYLMLIDFYNPSLDSMCELGQATFVYSENGGNGSMQLYPYQQKNTDGTYSNVDHEEGAYLPFEGTINDDGMMLDGGTEEPDETEFSTWYMLKDGERQCIIGMLILPNAMTYWIFFIR